MLQNATALVMEQVDEVGETASPFFCLQFPFGSFLVLSGLFHGLSSSFFFLSFFLFSARARQANKKVAAHAAPSEDMAPDAFHEEHVAMAAAATEARRDMLINVCRQFAAAVAAAGQEQESVTSRQLLGRFRDFVRQVTDS